MPGAPVDAGARRRGNVRHAFACHGVTLMFDACDDNFDEMRYNTGPLATASSSETAHSGARTAGSAYLPLLCNIATLPASDDQSSTRTVEYAAGKSTAILRWQSTGKNTGCS